MADTLEKQAAELPTTSGVYLFKSSKGKVLYVGKAINVRGRVRQYILGHDERYMVPFLVAAAKSVEAIATQTEKDALILENTLIKKHRPRFNAQLRDDRNFLHIRLHRRAKWPRYTLVRAIKNDKATYFGPYTSASKARQTLAALERTFPLRTCTDQTLKTRRRPCLLHQMKRCVAPCVDLVKTEAYSEIVDESLLFLNGKKATLIDRLEQRMRDAAEREAFEEAARLRDLIQSIRATLEKQRIVDTKLGDRDVWGFHREGARGVVAIIPVREGYMAEPMSSPTTPIWGDLGDFFSSALNDAYPVGADIPPEILVPESPPDADALMELLSERLGKKVVIRVPQRGSKLNMMNLAHENARLIYQREHDEDARRLQALDDLQHILRLHRRPTRIECFDNSNFQGDNPVAAMAVFLDGLPTRAEYRRYKIKTVIGADDYASMYEIIDRRVRRAVAEDTVPDLMVIDGGRGQVNAARAALKANDALHIPLVGISKPHTEHRKGQRSATDKLILPQIKEPIRLDPSHPALRMVQHIRDETHNHAIRYHRKVRNKETLTSILEAIPGVGPSRRTQLLKHFGSAAAVANADLEQISAVPGFGDALAQMIYTALHPQTSA